MYFLKENWKEIFAVVAVVLVVFWFINTFASGAAVLLKPEPLPSM
jgi:hypothetical protein